MMGRIHNGIDGRLESWLLSQPVFFVATAPLSPSGHVNCSPRSNNGELMVLGPFEVAFLDRTGSGIETIAHLRENGRIVLMACAFEGPPRVVRLHGVGKVLWRAEAAFQEIARRFRPESLSGARGVVHIEVERVADSCGYGVPLMDFTGRRPQIDDWHARKGEEGMLRYWADKNARSIDGLPVIEPVIAT